MLKSLTCRVFRATNAQGLIMLPMDLPKSPAERIRASHGCNRRPHDPWSARRRLAGGRASGRLFPFILDTSPTFENRSLSRIFKDCRDYQLYAMPTPTDGRASVSGPEGALIEKIRHRSGSSS